MPIRTELPLATLAAAILAALGYAPTTRAATITVDGSTCTLVDAIRSANQDTAIGGCAAGSGTDLVVINGGSELGSEIPAITGDTDFTGAFGSVTNINTENSGRLFFVGGNVGGVDVAPRVSFRNLSFNLTRAQGGAGVDGGGGGAGLGGVIYVYAGNVTIRNLTFNGLSAAGGAGSMNVTQAKGGGGGGGMSGAGGTGGDGVNGGAGNAPRFGGGGGGGGDGASIGGDGGYVTGGEGGIEGGSGTAGGFGGGGGGAAGSEGTLAANGASGGFGGGGGGGGSATSGGSPVAGDGANGGFGGGGGAGGNSFGGGGDGGNGGFGGGGGAGGVAESAFGTAGSAGFGAGNGDAFASGGGAGLGGAIFVRTGRVDISRSTFTNNSATGGTAPANAGRGLGGAIFALDSLQSANGNAQGYPNALPVTTGCGNSFTTNSATHDQNTDTDNDDTYGVSRTTLATECIDLFSDGFE